MYLTKPGTTYNGLTYRNYSYSKAVSRLQEAVHFFMDTLNAERFYALAERYDQLSNEDRKRFDLALNQIDEWLAAMTDVGSTGYTTNEIEAREVTEIE